MKGRADGLTWKIHRQDSPSGVRFVQRRTLRMEVKNAEKKKEVQGSL
jgi:hypothetical protein